MAVSIFFKCYKPLLEKLYLLISHEKVTMFVGNELLWMALCAFYSPAFINLRYFLVPFTLLRLCSCESSLPSTPYFYYASLFISLSFFFVKVISWSFSTPAKKAIKVMFRTDVQRRLAFSYTIHESSCNNISFFHQHY